jgi:hypothetical protein
MKCPQCGAENPDSVHYCQKCAHDLTPDIPDFFPTLWYLGVSMSILGVVLAGLYWMGAVTGPFAGPILLAGSVLFLAGLITVKIYHKRED